MDGFADGFIARFRPFFTQEGWDQLQARIEAWWEEQRKGGWKATFKAGRRFALKWTLLVLIAVAATVLFVRGLMHGETVLILATIPAALVLIKDFRGHPWPSIVAAWLMVGLGALGMIAWFLNLFDLEWHITAIGGVLLVFSLAAIYRIEKRVIVVIAVFLAAAAVISLLNNLVNAITFGHWPADLVTHLLWIILAPVALFAAAVWTKRWAAVVLAAICLAEVAGAYFLWGFDGLRWEEWAPAEPWGHITYNDQGVTGFLLLAAAATVLVSSLWRRGGSTNPDTAEAETDEPEPIMLMESLYRLDKQEQVFREDWTGFLAKALRKLRLTQDQLDEAGVTMARYNQYAKDRVYEEVDAADVLTKTRKISKPKIKALGFRSEFFEDHAIKPEELLTIEPT